MYLSYFPVRGRPDSDIHPVWCCGAGRDRGRDVDLPPPNFLTENTLIYPGDDVQENLIHFGRFGNFDWYYTSRCGPSMPTTCFV